MPERQRHVLSPETDDDPAMPVQDGCFNIINRLIQTHELLNRLNIDQLNTTSMANLDDILICRQFD